MCTEGPKSNQTVFWLRVPANGGGGSNEWMWIIQQESTKLSNDTCISLSTLKEVCLTVLRVESLRSSHLLPTFHQRWHLHFP